MGYLIRKVYYEELDKAFSLISNTFSGFVAPYYCKEGIDTFSVNFIENEDFKDCFKNDVATILFNQIFSELKEKQVEKIAINASPYAVPFYHAIGFKDLDGQQDFHGILYTPMEFML